MAPFSKPETVLKQAEGLVSVGQTHAALQSLTEMFSSKRFRSTPLTSLEPIMHRFIELCVDMRKGRTAKEGLMQYKNIAQNTSVQSIEAVITRFIQLADAKVKDAQEKAAQSAVDIDDLEASETPESILLGAVSGDQSKDRTDRALVTPWLKFLWESYRTSLETLKNNARLEVIYQQIAQQAFKFCLKHQRKVEFRRLCETLRLHLSNVAKYSHQQHSINLSDPDTLQHHLDTRFAQLNTSVELELWQEAFRSVEDVHNLLTMAKKAPRPAMMANYYEKLTKIFLMSGNALFHAAAWGKYYSLVTSIGGKSEEEMSRLAGQVLISALAVPVGIAKDEPEELKGKNARLTSLLGLNKMPSRGALLKDALSRDVLKLSPEAVQKLYTVLEVNFEPLTLCASVADLLKTLSADPSYSSYLPLLQRALFSRLLSQISQVYSTIKISNLLSLVTPLRDAGLEGAYDDEQVEAYIMGCARRGELSIRVDHKDGSITFVDDAFGVTEEPVASTSTLSNEQSIQPSVAELVRTRLSKVAVSLHSSLQKIEGSSKVAELTVDEQQAKFKALVSVVQGERKALQLRRALVARRRELLSELSVRKEKEESSRRAELNRKEKEAEAIRIKDELKRKEIERTKKEIENIRIDEAKKYAQTLVDKGIIKTTELDKLENYDTEGLITIQVAQLEKEKRDMNEKLRIVSKRIDHIERAYRKEERPLLAQDYEQQQKSDKETFFSTQKGHFEAHKKAHEENVATKSRLARMRADYDARKQQILARSGAAYEAKIAAAEQKMEEEKDKRRKAVFKAREEERLRHEKEEAESRAREEREREAEAERLAEEERREREEEEKRAREEEEKAKAAEAATAARAAREKERQEALEKARLQQQREEEAEARRKARAEEREREKLAPAARRPLFGGAAAASAPAKEETSAWRRSTPTNSVPATPTSRSGAGGAVPERTASPSPAPGKYRPGASSGAGGAAGAPAAGGWRARELAKKAAEEGGAGDAGVGGGSGANTPARVASPAPASRDEDGFQSVRGGGTWKRGRGRG